MAEDQSWERKFKALRKDYIALEKQLSKQQDSNTTEILTKVAKSLSIGLRGEDSNLDTQLEKLYVSLSSPDLPNISSVARTLDRQLRKKDSRKKRTASAMLVPLRRWILELKTLTKNDFNLNNLDAIHQRSEHATESYHDLPSILSSVVRLQSDIFKQLLEPEAEQLTQVDSLTDDELERLLRQISIELLDLISTLHMPPNRRRLGQQLARKLEIGISLEELPDLVLRIIQLVSHSCAHLRDEFERYLLQVSTELVEMNALLADQHDELARSGEAQLELSKKVAVDVKNLHESTVKASSLSSLKEVVRAQIGSVQTTVQELRTTERQRLETAESRYSALSERVREVEIEARETHKKAEEERLRSRIDQLTRLPNRVAYDEKFARCIERAKVNQMPLTLTMCDIDHFKRINDGYGHLTGDKALRLIGRVLQDSLRAGDFVCRYGGEEFAIIMQDTDITTATQVLEPVRSAVEQSPFNFNGTPIPITLSFGATQYRTGESQDTLFERADSALYRAKDEGRNCIRFSE